MSKKTHEISLSPEEFEELIEDLAEFDENSFIYLAETDQYEIIPTETEEGEILTKNQMDMLRRECNRLGCRILYKIDKRDGETILVNSLTARVMVLKEGMQ